MRLRNIASAPQKLAEFPEIVVQNPQKFKGLWAKKIFENKNKIHIEIGSGRGNFIINSAKQNPNINYIGIEKFDSVLLRALEKVADMDVENLRFLRFDATQILDIFDVAEIEKIYLNFSDPWDKNAYKNRRLTHRIFLKKYEKILKNGGALQFKTDNRELFEFSIKEFNNFGLRINEINLNLHENEPSWNIRTEYEEKFAGFGKNIYFSVVSFGG
ncbi:MAG: tRNA (guanosine(46)-N7)-methyltransferase TrmB [Chitinivibrionia bacterium]|nr:tRNA (guanosine(46)-N7)-methyltransferase TrmB [Chitinivibrionia bacterium]